ncbi:MAG: hypothetical protein HKM95_10100 [Inquilinus sp.]|nr:hypothetical protein [Inquilinus sp.]
MTAMFGRSRAAAPPGTESARPTLELSGPALTTSLETLVSGTDEQGGIERYVDGLKYKAALFAEALAEGRAVRLDEESFKGLCAFMAPVRRRIGTRLAEDGFPKVREAVVELLDGAADTTTADARIRRFCTRFPDDRKHRWVRDLAAEVLHNTYPELYPLMCRWVWDAKANSGVLREIWHGENVDHLVIDISDTYETFLVLREELSGFVTDNGVFREVPFYVDLLCAQIYAGYISSQGGSYLRTDFSSPEDPMQYTRRLLGLDGIDASSGRTRFKTVDGTAHVLEDIKLLD